MKRTHTSRIKKALTLLKDLPGNRALVLSSNPSAIRSRDTHFPYRQNSDLYYFTGSHHQELVLVLRPHAKSPVTLVAPAEDATKRMWEGSQPSVAALAKELGAESVVAQSPISATRSLLRGIETAYLPSVAGSVGAALREELATKTSHALRGLPSTVIEAERLTSQLRCIKDAGEIKLIQEAAELTSAALIHTAQYIRRGIRERDIAVMLDYLYRLHDAEPSFNTIVASGRSAAVLHYHALNRTLKNGELLLIDTGCERDMYASDVSRTIPVGDISPQLEDLYEVVRSAQAIAIAAVRPGIHIRDVHKAAAKELTRGLVWLGVLRGKVAQLVKNAAYKPWFPHGIGHSLGIDVHDVAPEAGDQLGVLRPGMVITIEPGLYFAKPVAKIPACGIRIEDDVLVTNRGREVLTEGVFPKELDEVRAITQ